MLWEDSYLPVSLHAASNKNYLLKQKGFGLIYWLTYFKWQALSVQ